MWGEHVVDLPVMRLKSLNFNAAILSWSTQTVRIPFGRYAVTKAYSKSLGTLSWFTTPLKGGI
jgi:hypothetical protein